MFNALKIYICKGKNTPEMIKCQEIKYLEVYFNVSRKKFQKNMSLKKFPKLLFYTRNLETVVTLFCHPSFKTNRF